MWLFYICCLHSVFTLGPQQTQWGASKKYSREVNQLQILKGEMRTDRQTFICLEFMENVMFFFSLCVWFLSCDVFKSSCLLLQCFKGDVDRSATQSAMIRLGKLVWEGAAETSGPVDTGSLVWAWHSKYSSDDFSPCVFYKISHLIHSSLKKKKRTQWCTMLVSYNTKTVFKFDDTVKQTIKVWSNTTSSTW